LDQNKHTSWLEWRWSGIIEVQCSISEQGNLVLKSRIDPSAEFDDNDFVIIIFHKVNQLLEAVDVVINWIFGLIPSSPLELGKGSELLILGAELVNKGFLKGLPVLEIISLAL
jgi:hypothetical protein